MKIEYPTWKVRGGPTPNERLVICSKCGKASWTIHSSPPIVKYCYVCPKRERERMREATPDEYVQGKAALEKIL